MAITAFIPWYVFPFQAIGSSAQGLTNALLFCVFTSTVRKRLLSLIRQLCCTCCSKDNENVYLLEHSSRDHPDLENTTQYDDGDHEIPRAEAGVVDCSRRKSTAHDDTSALFHGSLENSKYHSVSVGKRVTNGAE